MTFYVSIYPYAHPKMDSVLYVRCLSCTMIKWTPMTLSTLTLNFHLSHRNFRYFGHLTTSDST
jgi:hypothetical protein